MAENTKPVFRAIWRDRCSPATILDVCDMFCKSVEDLKRDITESYEQANKKEP